MRIKAQTVCLQQDDGFLRRADRPAALTAALGQLTAGLRGCDAEFLLCDWPLTPATTRTYINTLPALTACGFRIQRVVLDGTLTDELLTVVLAAGTQIRSLQVGRLSLQSDTHANTPWPWEEVVVRKMSLGDVLKLPNPAGAGGGKGQCVVCVRELVIDNNIDKVSL